jgi:hypothetical protein
MLLTIDPDKDFINVKGVAVASVLLLQSARITSPELDAPEAERFSGYSDASFSEQVFDISVTEIESVVSPDRIADDVRRESVPLVCIHLPILAVTDF